MRPLKLTITAFGPYAGEQVVDFAQLKGRNLFVITGDTGAGKTTILDGISYALYGRASGRERDGESLRSHFASADLLTCVELEFELGGQRYWVKRIPKQRKKRTRGEGYTDQNADAEFKKLDGESCLVTGVKEVNDKMVDIMGLSYEQFKQIIMIPQGEFRELLNADSKMRQEILQKIFGTEGFRRIQELFDGEAKALSQEIIGLESQRNEWIRSLDGSGYEPLAATVQGIDYNMSLVMNETKQAIAMDDQAVKETKIQIDEYEQKAAAKQEEIFQGKGNNLKFDIRDEAEKKKMKLEAYQSDFDEKKKKLQQGRRALGLIGIDEYCNQRREYAEKKRIELEKIQKQEEKAKTDAQIGETRYQSEMDKEKQRTELLAEQVRLQGLAGKVADWENRQVLAIKLENELTAALKERDQVRKKLERAREEIQGCQVSLEQGRAAVAEYALKAREEEKISSIYEKLNVLQEEFNHLLSLEELIVTLKEQTAEQFASYEKTQEEYEKAQHLFFEGQAGILASKLNKGEPCPVCGSGQHPKLAVIAEDSPTESELKKLIKSNKLSRQLYDDVNGRYERSKAEYHAQYQILSRLKKELGEETAYPLADLSTAALLQYIAQKLPEYQLHREQLQIEIKKIPLQKMSEEELSIRLTEKTEEVNGLIVTLEDAELRYMELFAQFQSAKDAMEGLTAEVPYDVRSVGSLAAKLANVEEQYHMMKRALEEAEKISRNCEVDYAKAMAERNGAEKALQEGETELEIAKSNFIKALAAAGFNDQAEYEKAKLREDEISALEQEINGYHEELRSATDSYQKAQQDVENLIPVHIEVLENQWAALQLEKNELIAKHTAFTARRTHNQTIFKKIDAVIEKLESKEEEYLLIGHLARIAKGDNEQKISFERYVLAAFFNDIIAAANSRLRKMTGGRYQMSRIAQKGKGSGQSGLEIEVFDYYTGQSRHVKTLSGGESFKASLALALGLAEVVQSYAGGVSLETMFVDEGFGTLDPESLDAAISCLIELQYSGRLVGIISHVPELKGSIDARLEIEAGKDGSRAQFYIM